MSVFWRPRGCVLWFDFGTLKGNKVYDLSKQDNHGTIYGAIWRRGHLTGALSFDGVDDYVEVPHSASLVTVNAFTVEVFVRVVDSADFRGLFGKTEWNIAAPYDVYVPKGENNMRYFIGNGTSSQSVDAVGKVIFNKWQHWAFIYDGTDQIIYLDGNEVARKLVKVPVGDTGKPVFVGSREDKVTVMYGYIAFVRIYNRALSAREIKAHYHYLTKPIARVTL